MPVERATVEQQLSAIGEADLWWDVREVRELPAILQPEERILAIVRGKVLHRFRPSRSWLIVVTDGRVTCMRATDRVGRRQIDIPLAAVSSISHRTGLLHARVHLIAGDRKYRFRASKTDGLKLVGALATLIRRLDPLPRDASAPPLPAVVSREEHATMLQRVDLLEDELERLRQQIDFVENLLERRERTLYGADALPAAAATRD